MSALKSATEIAKKARMGLEELLKPQARVIYENVFSTRHIGRIIDFLLFEARPFIEKHPDSAQAEYRIRQAVEVGVFNAWSNYRKGEKTKCVEIELGWDDERLVLAISHYADSELKNFVPGQGQPPNATSERMRKMLERVQELSNGLIVRQEPESGRMQVLAFISAKDAEKVTETQFVAVEPGALHELPRVNTAVPAPLADGDIQGFVTDEKAGHPLPSIGEAAKSDQVEVGGVASNESGLSLVKGGLDTEEESTNVSGAADGEDDLLRVKGGTAAVADEEKIRVKGATASAEDEEKLVVKGGATPTTKEEKILVKGKNTVADMSTINVKLDKKLAKVSIDKIDTMSAEAAVAIDSDKSAESEATADENSENETNESVDSLLDTVKSEVMPLCSGVSEVQFQETFAVLSRKIRENYEQTLHHMLRVQNIQMISKIKHYKDQVQLLNARIDELKAESDDMIESISQKDTTEGEILRLRAAGDKRAVAKASQEELKVRETIQQYQVSIEKDQVPKGAKDWGKGLLEAALKERALLGQRTREIEANLKKREYDYRNKENALKEEVRIKDEQLRQKDFTLEKTKESLANAIQSFEKSRAAMSTASDKSELALKLASAEKLLSVAKDSNDRMQKRVEDVQKKWQEEFNTRSSLQQEKSKLQKQTDDLQRKLNDAQEKGSKVDEVARITEARDKALRIIDDLRKQMKELQGKLNSGNAGSKAQAGQTDPKKRGEPQADAAELKHRLDQTNKIATVMKEDLDRTKKRFDELKQSETKLRVEVARLAAELKSAGKNPYPEKTPSKPQQRSNASPLHKPKTPVKPPGGTGGTGAAGGAKPK